MAVQAPPTVRVTCREYLGWHFGVGVPYLTLLVDLAGINAKHPLPRIPQTATEAAVRLCGERQRRMGRERLEAARARYLLEEVESQA